jgi:hypothetical protein
MVSAEPQDSRTQTSAQVDGDDTIEPGVARLVDLAHAARAERREDFVRAEACAGSKGHRAWFNQKGCGIAERYFNPSEQTSRLISGGSRRSCVSRYSSLDLGRVSPLAAPMTRDLVVEVAIHLLATNERGQSRQEQPELFNVLEGYTFDMLAVQRV